MDKSVFMLGIKIMVKCATTVHFDGVVIFGQLYIIFCRVFVVENDGGISC